MTSFAYYCHFSIYCQPSSLNLTHHSIPSRFHCTILYNLLSHFLSPFHLMHIIRTTLETMTLTSHIIAFVSSDLSSFALSHSSLERSSCGILRIMSHIIIIHTMFWSRISTWMTSLSRQVSRCDHLLVEYVRSPIDIAGRDRQPNLCRHWIYVLSDLIFIKNNNSRSLSLESTSTGSLSNRIYWLTSAEL